MSDILVTLPLLAVIITTGYKYFTLKRNITTLRNKQVIREKTNRSLQAQITQTHA